MANTVIHATISLDGFIAGLNDEMGWMDDYYGPDAVADEIIRSTGAVVTGGRLFRLIKYEDQLPYGGATKVPVFVVTHQAQESVTQFGVTFQFITSLEAAIRQAIAVAGKKNVMLFGASIAQQCLAAGLADEIQLHLAPILLGKGIRLFGDLSSQPVRLERLQVVESATITDLRFRVLR